MAKRRADNTVRIIGGAWGGRHLQFVESEDLRPTKDRIRETLFNWLVFALPGSRCLDLFAGSGALGFEAASRGAKDVVLVEKEHAVCQQLREQVDVFNATQLSVVQQSAEQYLKQSVEPFDLVFLDPPFNAQLLQSTLQLLDTQACLKPGGLIYFEHDAKTSLPELPQAWSIVKQKQAGQVLYGLVENQAV